MPRSWSHLINAALLILIATSGVVYERWALAAGGWGVAALMYATAWVVGRYPDRASAPNQAKYDALPTAAKQRVMAAVQRWLGWETAGLLTVVGALQWLPYTVASSFSEPLVLIGVIGFTLLSTATAPFLIWRVEQLVDALHDQMPPADPERGAS